MEEFPLLMEYQRKYGKRGSEAASLWLLRKRTLNIACMVVSKVKNINFENFTLALYFRCDDKEMRQFLRTYEMQMEEAAINPEKFVANLHAFFISNCQYLEENHLYRGFYDFCKLLEQQRRVKIAQGHKEIFDAYLSLLMQQGCYFSRNHIEDSVIGISANGGLIFQKNLHPYSDMAIYDLEKHHKDILYGRKPLTEEFLYKLYKPYGYEVRSVADVERLESMVKVYDNNNFALVPYINERTKEIVIQKEYQHYMPEFPRQWKRTSFYKEKLLKRKYMLPVTGITADFINAGFIRKIIFIEIVYNDEMILLYRVITKGNGELSGYYQTKSQTFYSIYEHTNRHEWHEALENFILENYMILTCDYEIDRKKNFAIKQADHLETEFYFPYQPLVKYTYKSKRKSSLSGTATLCKYSKKEYQEEVRNRSGYIRTLPKGQKVSMDAIQYAAQLGLSLPDGKTFVRTHEFHVYTKIQAKI